MTKKEIGEEIKKKREYHSVSMYRMGRLTDMQPCIVNSIEIGEKAYSIDSLIKTCKALGLELVIKEKGGIDVG